VICELKRAEIKIVNPNVCVIVFKESRACEEGLRLALQWSNKPMAVELDCSVLVGAIKEKSPDRSPLAHLIAEIRVLASDNRHKQLSQNCPLAWFST
jgi:hypothetical protein